MIPLPRCCRIDGRCLSGQPGQGGEVKCSLRRPDCRRIERAEPHMELMEKAGLANGTPGKEGAAAQPPGTRTMESQTICAYNQTRECFLGLKVKAGDLSSTHVSELMLEKPMKSGEGLWMKPFRGIAAT